MRPHFNQRVSYRERTSSGNSPQRSEDQRSSKSMSRMRNVALVFLFLCGLSAYAFQSAPPPGGQRGQGAGRGPMNVEDQAKQLTERLNLTDDQQAKVKAILEDGRTQRQKLPGH